jgi:hypothetical protein
MSHSFYDEKWQSSMEELSDLIYVENPDAGFDENGDPLPVLMKFNETEDG